MILWRLTRPFRTNTKKRYPFHHRGLEYKSRKSTDTWNNRQVWPWSTKWSRAKTNKVLPRECIGHNKYPLPTTQETTLHMDITRWSLLNSDWLNPLPPKMEKLYTVSKSRPGANCSSNHQFPIAKFRLKLRKVGKTSSPFRYDLHHIPNDYTVEVTNRFKWLNLVDRVPEELRTELCDIVKEVVTKIIPPKKKCKKSKWLSEKGLQIAEKRREMKGKGEKER